MDLAKDPDSRRSVSGNNTFFFVGRRLFSAALSVTKVELFASTSNVQDMMYVKRILESIRLKVELPLILEMDNKGAVDLINNFSVGGRTCNTETRQYRQHGKSLLFPI